MSGSIVVRRIRSDEGVALMEVRLAALLDAPFAFESTYESSAQRPVEHWVARAGAASAGPRETVYVAEKDGRLVGMAGAFPDEPNRVLYGMWVEPEHRRAGVGDALTGEIVNWAKTTPAAALNLWVVEDNAAAVALYRKHGFEPTGRSRAMRGDSAQETEMSLRLSGE